MPTLVFFATFYKLLKELARGAPACRLQGFRQGIAFAVFVMGTDELKPCILSRRCLGCAFEDSPKEPNQALPLTLAQLQVFHDVVKGADDPWGRLAAGTILPVF